MKDKFVFDKMLVGAKKMNTFKRCGRKKIKNTVGVDLISNLPDSVLAHILSFLSTEEAIRTCILSKTWKYIWTAVPILEFDFEKFCRDRRALDGTGKEGMEKVKECEMKYVRFVKNALLNRESLLLDKFKLHWINYIDNYHYTPESITELLPHALKLKPRVLSVDFHLNNCQNLDIDSIFTCASLEDVLLNCNYNLEKFAPYSINLPHLKKLNLERLDIGSNFLNKLLFGCPLLEELTLCNCALYFHRIDFNFLKKLIIVDCYASKDVEKLEIFTPSLLYLEIERCIGLKNVSARNMPSLVDATIEFGWYEDDVVIGSEPNLLNSLSNLTSLHVIVECDIKKLKNGASNCPTFNNLKSLSILWRVNYNFDFIAFFLHNSPNLQDITLWDEILWENATPNLGLEEPKDDLFRREHLAMVTLVNCNMREISSETFDLLVKNFYAHVRTIGKILIPN